MNDGIKRDGSVWYKEPGHYLCRDPHTLKLHVNFHGNPGIVGVMVLCARECCDDFLKRASEELAQNHAVLPL